MYRKQKNLIGSKRMQSTNIDAKIKKLMAKRNTIRQNIHHLWKNKMSDSINKQLDPMQHILFIGFNIFPKDYRVKINLPMAPLQINIGNNIYLNKIFYDIRPSSYAANQIKFYLKAYTDKIVRGAFPLNLLNTQYLGNKYEKFTEYYYKQGYSPVPHNNLIDLIKQLNKQLINRDKIIDKTVYIATLYKAGDTIPVNGRTPIEGFLNKEDAITNIKTKIKHNAPIYLYKISADQFNMVDGKLFATQSLNPTNEETLLLT